MTIGQIDPGVWPSLALMR
uniref:Uncharacterized protein n=1 Tax=Arundo donax TaxID=35708 RepID=A0A0A9ALR8_ARUDO